MHELIQRKWQSFSWKRTYFLSSLAKCWHLLYVFGRCFHPKGCILSLPWESHSWLKHLLSHGSLRNINVITEIECAAVLLDLNIYFCLYKSEEHEDIWGLAVDSGMRLLLSLTQCTIEPCMVRHGPDSGSIICTFSWSVFKVFWPGPLNYS